MLKYIYLSPGDSPVHLDWNLMLLKKYVDGKLMSVKHVMLNLMDTFLNKNSENKYGDEIVTVMLL